MRTIPGISIARKCCRASVVPKPEQQWTRSNLHSNIFSTLYSTRQRICLSVCRDPDAGTRQPLCIYHRNQIQHVWHVSAPQGSLADPSTVVSAPSRAITAFMRENSRGLRQTPDASSIPLWPSTGSAMTLSVSAVGPVDVPGPASVSTNKATAPGTPVTVPGCEASITGLAMLGHSYDQYINSDFLGPGPLPAGRKIYLIVLNYCLPAGLLHVWPLATFRICADGGSNRLYDELPTMMPPPPEEVAGLEAPAEKDAHEAVTEAATAVTATRSEAAQGGGEVESVLRSNMYNLGQTSANGGGAAFAPQCNGYSNSSNDDVRDGDPRGDSGPSYKLKHHQRSAAGLGLHTDTSTLLRLAYLPDVILGDLDSLRPDVRQYYVEHGVPFMDMSYDQDTNDLAKAISLIEERFVRTDPDHGPDRHQILVLGALGGRLDHTLANLNALHMFSHLNITLWGDGNLARLVRPGKALITPDERFEGPTCGLIPIAGPVTATSTGLKWNVASTQLRVGGLVSSSNLLTGTAVEVSCDGSLLWSTEMRMEPRPDLRTVWARTAAAAAAARAREGQQYQQQQQQQQRGAADPSSAGVLTEAAKAVPV